MGLPPTLAPTEILDFQHPSVRSVEKEISTLNPPSREFLQAAHQRIAELVRPIYTVDEHQPVSVTLSKQRGSCSQRMACLEAVGRAHGIPSRVRALWVDGRFWNPRFRLLAPFIPRRILLLWPQFRIDGKWIDFDELYGSPHELGVKGTGRFTNDSETLFEAVQLTSVDFCGKSKTCNPPCASSVDLSHWVLADSGFFDTRDEALSRLGSMDKTLRGRIFELIFANR